MSGNYVNKSKRVFAFDKKFIIPGGDSVELTDAEEKAPLVQKYIENGSLVKVTTSAAPVNAAANVDPNDKTVDDKTKSTGK